MLTTFYPPYHVGGACTHVYHLANELAGRGHEVHVIYCQDSYYLKRKERPDILAYKNHENITLYPLKSSLGFLSPLSSYLFGYPFFKSKIKKIIGQENFEFIHYHNISLLGPKVFQYGNSKKIYTAHDHWLICPLNDPQKDGENCRGKNCNLCLIKHGRLLQLWRYSSLSEKSFSFFDEIISPSKYLKKFYSNFGVGNSMKVIPNFVPAPFNNLKNKEDSSFFLYVGMLEPVKGILNLIDVFSKVDEKLLIAGTGSLKEKAKKVIKNKNLKNVKLLGWKTKGELDRLYQDARATILPSLCPENSPLALLESLSFGTPVIGSNLGGIPEIVSKVDKNLIFEPKNPRSLHEVILNFDQRKYMPTKIKDIYRKNYSPEVYLEKYLRLLN